MSLVVCANQEQDGSTIRSKQSIYSAYSFKNTLTSTYKIPKDAQVALQSCKVNVDGRVVFSKNNNRFYQYTGEKLNRDGVTEPQMDDVTSHPVVTPLIAPNQSSNEVEELSVNDFANLLEDRIRSTTYHPNYKGKATVSVLRNASSLDFLGYKTSYDQHSSANNINTVPPNDDFENFFNEKYDDITDIFSYTGGVFQRNASSKSTTPAMGISGNAPLSLANGEFVVNISGSSGRCSASGVPWFVGLSRYINTTTQSGFYAPPYARDASQKMFGVTPAKNQCFSDFFVMMDKEQNVHVGHAVMGAKNEKILLKEVKYYQNASSDFTSVLNLSGTQYEDVKFTATGEKMKLEIYNAKTTSWEVVVQHNEAESMDQQFKPINQACWCLHPVLGVFSKSGARSCTLDLTRFDSVPAASISGYDPTEIEKAGWWETLELQGVADKYCFELERRSWNLPLSGTAPDYTYKGLNASNCVDYDNVLIMDVSNIYTPSFGANAGPLLGFNTAIVDEYASETGALKVFESDFAPDLQSSMAMFVRLNNFGQNVVNSFTGNHSKILAHLPRFDNSQSTGRLYFEPQNLVWIDLGNPAEMAVNEFDISFCYVNEQYATVLTGQSIVCLYFREKPKELKMM